MGTALDDGGGGLVAGTLYAEDQTASTHLFSLATCGGAGVAGVAWAGFGGLEENG
jgi:hypothetical protein